MSCTFGEHHKPLRTSKNHTMRALASSVGMTSGYLSQIENNEVPPPADEKLAALARILDQDRDEFFGKARRLPPDLSDIICEHARHYSALLRSLRSLTREQ